MATNLIEIRKITIQNIKGFGATENVIETCIKPNKYNLLVAPNGFGKSSIAAAFNSLKSTRLSVQKDDKYRCDENLTSSLKLDLNDGSSLIADDSQNTISSQFNIYVINKLVSVRATAPRIDGFQTAHGELVVPSVVIVKNIPDKISFNYNYSQEKNILSRNGSWLPNITSFISDKKFFAEISNLYTVFDKFEKSGTKRDILINNIIADIRSANVKTTIREAKASFASDSLDKLQEDDQYSCFISDMGPFINSKPCVDQFLIFYQLLWFYRNDKKQFKKKCERAEYDIAKVSFNNNLSSLNTTGRKLIAKEHDNSLELEFPLAKEISNGQRDLLSFYARLFYFKSILKQGKKYLLIIDEVFDYLDDANFIAAQYYLSDIVNTKNVDVYVVMLTHLSPRYFHSNIFSEKKLNIQFLDKTLSVNNSPLIDLINCRNNLDKQNDCEEDLYEKMSLHLFHFSNSSEDLRTALTKQNVTGKCLDYSSTDRIKHYVFDQLSHYQQNDHYDSLAVALAIRIKTEQIFYEQITSIDKKKEFIATHSTKQKLDYVENKLHIDVPDTYRLLSPIYNHLHNVSDFYRVASALMNKVVQKLIGKVFS